MTTKTIAEERLLDITLAEVLAERRTAKTPRPPLLAAALFLAGIGVVATLLWQRRSAPPPAPVQEPQPAPVQKPVRANSSAELAALPANTTNLEVRLSSPTEAEGLVRFRDLRRLRVLPAVQFPELGTNEWPAYQEALRAAAQRFASADAFASLGTLRTLETLELHPNFALDADRLGFLRNLRLTTLAVDDLDLGSHETIAALLAAPTFRTLRLRQAVVGSELFATLEPLQLERLELSACPGVDDHAWQALARLKSLRALEVTNLHGGTTSVGGRSRTLGTLGDAGFDAFAALPALQHLGLAESEFPGDLLTRLPDTLTSLDLGDRPMTAGDARSLRRLTKLRSLTFGSGLEAKDAMLVLPKWSLERLDYRGLVHGHAEGRALLDTIAAQPQLAEFAMRVMKRTDLSLLAKAPRLRVIALLDTEWGTDAPGIPIAQLEPLAACKELRTLRIRSPKLDERAIRELFGDRVEVELITKF